MRERLKSIPRLKYINVESKLYHGIIKFLCYDIQLIYVEVIFHNMHMKLGFSILTLNSCIFIVLFLITFQMLSGLLFIYVFLNF